MELLEKRHSHATSGETEATILVKALPQVGERHGETVCVAAVDAYRNWLRLYPVAFRQLEDAQKFRRWQRIKFKWRLPPRHRDNRSESRNIDQQSIVTVGHLRTRDRAAFLEPLVVHSTKREFAEGRSLAVVRPDDPEFFYRPRDPAAMAERRQSYKKLLASPDMFGARDLIPLEPAPFDFGYKYRDADGLHDCRCHDWEIEQTFLNWRRQYGEEETLRLMCDTFGNKYPTEGMLLAMGTHSRYPDKWMIIGVLKVSKAAQPPLL
ncbi:MAG TPA: hypothetical protein VE891_04860 [Allosphingosinicella sp.]|nr:hypothetical protein [Allosphingosinicella sp.]